MLNRITKLLILLLYIPVSSFGSNLGLNGCGEYEFQGNARIHNGKVKLIVNEKSLSEIILSPTISDEAKLAPYVNLLVKGEVNISKITGPHNAYIRNFISIDYAESDPLKLTKHTFLVQKRMFKCK